ncbi:formate/nitrite transporter family protein [Candidatus Nitrosacidococcus sp. I8]|uniref:formate/nitrite transporter family protein n=1 Tax=Candidatus Nitrosacidococcus sp. I8 TaxID=2942908 RepID=UPI002225EA53|nr:formate/nitrite transporter family protein [Candidatus Nitrosacidococcus sp. I8]CAH9019563.1 putative formate transporter 1 [Candidatus Nitrosacidococcus sp. I8]
MSTTTDDMHGNNPTKSRDSHEGHHDDHSDHHKHKHHHASHSHQDINDIVYPAQMGRDLAADAAVKDKLANHHILIRGFLCTPFLAYGACFAYLLTAQGAPSTIAGFMFPVGYIMLSALGLEMATGSFSVMPIGVYAGTVSLRGLARNWGLTYIGNVLGGLFFAMLVWGSLTKFGSEEPPLLLTAVAKVAEHKAAYMNYGPVIGWCSAIGMGILCNWLVSLGPIMAKTSHSMIGKVVMMWIAIGTFFALGFEHAVVNMFAFPLGILAGAKVTVAQWWLWNEIPVTIGNILGAVIFNSTLWYYTHSAEHNK